MRVILYSLIQEALGVEWDESIFAAGAIREDSLPSRPFAVIHLGVFNPGMAHVKDGSCTIWIHDDGGDYDRIDQALQAIYGRLHGAEHVSEQGGSAELIRAEWTATSGDLFDPGFRTITKNSSYRLIGTGV